MGTSKEKVNVTVETCVICLDPIDNSDGVHVCDSCHEAGSEHAANRRKCCICFKHLGYKNEYPTGLVCRDVGMAAKQRRLANISNGKNS